MAKKAKRRGRPPGAKNKSELGNGKSVAKMEVGELRAYIERMQACLSGKCSNRKRYLKRGSLSSRPMVQPRDGEDVQRLHRSFLPVPRPSRSIRARRSQA